MLRAEKITNYYVAGIINNETNGAIYRHSLSKLNNIALHYLFPFNNKLCFTCQYELCEYQRGITRRGKYTLVCLNSTLNI
jgi:hypothetical protein